MYQLNRGTSNRSSINELNCNRSDLRQPVLQGEDKKEAESRMADIDETLQKLIAVAKKRKYISADNTVESLRQEAERKVQDQAAKATITRMTQMKQRLDTQSAAVRPCTRFSACLGKCVICVFCRSDRHMQGA